jgi:hypothetical protein
VRILIVSLQLPLELGCVSLVFFNAVSKNDRLDTVRKWVIRQIPRSRMTISLGVSILIDAVAFWHSYGAPETHLRARSDTRRPF